MSFAIQSGSVVLILSYLSYLPRIPDKGNIPNGFWSKPHNANLSDICKMLDKVRTLPMLMASRTLELNLDYADLSL